MEPPRGLALCGAGLISYAHLAAARHLGLEVVAVASRTPERAAERAAQVGASAVGYAELPAGAQHVLVLTPPALHAGDTLTMLDAGAAVLVEKPLCRTLAEADALVAAAADHGERVLYGENLAYAPVVRELLQRAPALGTLTNLEVRALQHLPTWGDFTTDEWGGGALFDLGVHPLAVAVLAARVGGAGEVSAVECALRGGSGHGTDEHAEVSLHFESGLVGKVVSSWQGPQQPLWDAQLASATGVLRAELLPVPRLEQLGEPVALPPARTDPPLVDQYGYLDQLRAFVADVGDGRRPFMDAAFGRHILEIVCAAYSSAGADSAPVAMPFGGERAWTPLQHWRRGR